MEADPLTVPALEGERMPMRADDQDWWVWWHGPDETPPGTPRGHERGLVLVRSFWRAEVRIDPWEPEFEIAPVAYCGRPAGRYVWRVMVFGRARDSTSSSARSAPLSA